MNAPLTTKNLATAQVEDALMKEDKAYDAAQDIEAEIEQAGFKAYEDGACDDENPYQYGTSCHERWLAGWDRAYAHYWRERKMDEADAKDLLRRE